MNWFDLNEEERIKQVYSKYTIKDFWDYWSDNNNVYMEVRIKNWQKVKEVANKFSLKYSHSGVYVNSYIQLKNVIAYVRDKETIWCGINPRKKNWVTIGLKEKQKHIKTFSGKDDFIQSINYVFIDIDRIEKNGKATKNDLKNCDMLANLILEKLEKKNWNKNYIKICSGNGIQLLIKLDIFLELPTRKYNEEKKEFEYDKEFFDISDYIRNGIGKQILNFCKKHKKELNVGVDRSCFNIGRVCALPFTKNFKYDSFTWRGIVEIQNKENIGLSDYILNVFEKTDFKNYGNIFNKQKLVRPKNFIKKGELGKNPIVRLILNNNLPYGKINDTLWCQIKCLLRDNKFDLNSEEFRMVHKQLEEKLNGKLTTNFPDKKIKFNENVVNNYCIDLGIKPIYPLWLNKTNKHNFLLENISWGFHKYFERKLNLGDGDIFDDMILFKKTLKEDDINNRQRFAYFINFCIDKYGKKKTKYFFEYKIFYTFLSFD